MNIRHLACVVVLSTVSAVSTQAAGRADCIRAVDVRARHLIDDTLAVSPTVRGLATELGRSDVIAYVDVTLSPASPIAGTQLVVSTRESRYLRITINAMLGPAERAAMLAHELWHALEIAQARDVRTQKALRTFYRDAGGSTESPDKFETDGARNAEHRAWLEVRAGAAHAEPEGVRADNFPVTSGVTNSVSAQHRRDRAPALR